MKFIKILEKDKYALILRGTNLDEYAVVYGLDEENGCWECTSRDARMGDGYWNFGKYSQLDKAKALQYAVEYFRAKTEEPIMEEVIESRTIGVILLDMAKDMDHFDYTEHEEDAIDVLEMQIESLKLRCPELFTVLEIIALREE